MKILTQTLTVLLAGSAAPTSGGAPAEFCPQTTGCRSWSPLIS